MCVCVCVYAYLRVCMRVCARLYIRPCECGRVYVMGVCLYMCMRTDARTYVHMCVHVAWARSCISLCSCARGESNVINHYVDGSFLRLSLLPLHFILLMEQLIIPIRDKDVIHYRYLFFVLIHTY